FSMLFARSLGSRTEMYYTRNQRAYSQTLAICPSVIISGARQVTTCFDHAEGIYRWFVIPHVTPDFGTQQHELSHGFLYATYPAAEDFPWIKEGTGMYWESGSFDGAGNLIVSTPIPYLKTGFRAAVNGPGLIPLSALTVMSRADFYASEPTRVYSEAGMFI